MVTLFRIIVDGETCGTLTGRFSERALSFSDLDCPPAIRRIRTVSAVVSDPRQRVSINRDKQVLGVLVSAVITIALSGCGITSPSVGKSQTSAATGIVVGTDYVARSFAALALDGEGAVSAESLSTVVESVMLEPETQSVVGQRRVKAIYGDIAGANALILAVDEAEAAYPNYFSQWEPPRTIQWDDPNERTAGESGLCSAWLQRLSGPE